MRAAVAFGGPIDDTPLLRAHLAACQILVAADSGAAGLQALGLQPHVIIGDLDSLPAAALDAARAAGAEIAPHPAPQQRTDSHVALQLLLERGASTVVVLGAPGGERLDHALANLLLAAGPEFASLSVWVVAGWTEAVVLRGDGKRAVQISGEPEDYVSLVALSDTVTGVATERLRWPLWQATLRRGDGRGVSNELTDTEGRVRLQTGAMYVLHHLRRRRLPPAGLSV